MEPLRKEITIKNKQGLHARPAALFVQIASKYDANVTIEKDGARVNGKSIMGILTLGAQTGLTVILEVEGPEAEKSLQELETLLTREDI